MQIFKLNAKMKIRMIIESLTTKGINFIDNLNNDIQWQELICTTEETFHISENINTINNFIEYLNINNSRNRKGVK